MSDNSVALSRDSLSRILRVVRAAKKADRLERSAQLEQNDIARITKLGDAFGARIDMGRALDDLEDGDVDFGDPDGR